MNLGALLGVFIRVTYGASGVGRTMKDG